MRYKKGMLFCEISPTTYKISVQKGIIQRHIKNFFSKEKPAKEHVEEKLPCLVSQSSSNLIKRAKGIDITLQENKAVNIDIASKKINKIVIHPGEEFSFWRTVGKTSKKNGFLEGRVIEGNVLKPGVGGGLCNLGNTIHLLVLHSPLTVTEVHHHSDALAPENGPRVPFSSGTSISYNYIDFKFKNNTDQDFQLCVWCEDEKLFGELRSEREPECEYSIEEENHRFVKEGEKFYRRSMIYRVEKDKATGEIVDKKLIRDNRSEVMYDYDLIPQDMIVM